MKSGHIIIAFLLSWVACQISRGGAAGSALTGSTSSQTSGEGMNIVAPGTGASESITTGQNMVSMIDSERAEALLLANDPAAAVAALSPFLATHQDDEQANRLMAISLIKLNRIPDAKRFVNKGLAAHPNDGPLQLLAKTIDQPAIPILDIEKQMILEIPDAFERSWVWVQFYDGQKDYAGEMTALQEGLKINAKSMEVLDRLFLVAVNQKNWAIATDCVQHAADIDATTGKIFQGRLQFMQGNKEQAMQTLNDAVKQRPDSSLAWTVLGQVYTNMQRPSEAIDAFRKAVTFKPDNIVALRALVGLYVNQHDTDSMDLAVKYLAAARRLAPHDAQLRAYFDILGPREDAIAEREAYRKIDPTNYDNLARLSALYTLARQLDKAMDTLKELARQHPDNLAIADSLARLYRDNGDTDTAINVYQPYLASTDRATRFNARLLLGDMYRSTANMPAAIKMYSDAAREEKPGFDEAKRRLADLYFEMEKMPEAEALYKSIYNTEPSNDIRVLRRWIETVIRQDRYAEAKSLLDTQLFNQRPNDVEGSVLLGYSYLRQHKSREAMDLFDSVLAAHPDNTDSLHYRAYTRFVLLFDNAGAIADLLKVRAIMPTAVYSRLLLARVYYAIKQFPEAAHEYQAVLQIRPDLTSARQEYATMLLTVAQISLTMPKDSTDPVVLSVLAVKPVETLAAFLTESARLFPKQSVWPIMLGNLYGMTGDGDRAIEIHKSAFINSGKNLQIGTTYINTLMNLHRYNDALVVIDDLLKSHISSDLDAQRGTTDAALGRRKEAGDDFIHAADLSHDAASIITVTRQCYAALGADDASKLFQQRMDNNPKDYLSLIALGAVDSIVGNAKAAIDVVTPILNDTAAAPARPMALRMLAMAYYQLKAFDKSLNYYQQLLDIMPDDLEVLNNIAYLLANDMQRPEEALKYAQHALQIIDDRPIESSLASYSNVMDTVGWVKFMAGDVAGAVNDLQRSLQMKPSPISYYHLAVGYQKQGNMQKARDAALQSIALGMSLKDPTVHLAQELLNQLK